MRRSVLIALLWMTGCASDGLTPARPTESAARISAAGNTGAPTTAPVVIQIAGPKEAAHILVIFESIDCSCHLKDIDNRLLSLPGVVQVKWNTEEKTADLILDGSTLPGNPQIIEMAQMPGVKVFDIKRP